MCHLIKNSKLYVETITKFSVLYANQNSKQDFLLLFFFYKAYKNIFVFMIATLDYVPIQIINLISVKSTTETRYY